MKIGQELNSKIDQTHVRKEVSEGKRDFGTKLVAESQRMKEEKIENQIKDITELGEKIARFRSFRDLAKFKRMIKQFLKETVYEGLSLHESRSFHPTSHNQLMTVKEVDEKLIQLTEEVMDQEKTTVHLLGTIGEIRGLLINIVT